MLLRILTMNVDPARVADWLTFTRDIGFPGMLAQPGCRQVWRLRGPGGPHDYKVMTLWDSRADLDRFRASPALVGLTAAAAPLTTAAATEQLFDVIPDPIAGPIPGPIPDPIPGPIPDPIPDRGP